MKTAFDVIIIGGSFAGLSAAMSLGRAMRNVLVIDGGEPCNAPTPHSHNFITHDGSKPFEILKKAKQQVLEYPSVQFVTGIATSAQKSDNVFHISLKSGATFSARKLLFATGIKDIMPEVSGFSDCWGVSVLHCPYCHGYEVRNEKTGIVANGDTAFDLARLIQHWTRELTLFTNGKPTLSQLQVEKLTSAGVTIEERFIQKLEHDNGYINRVQLADGSQVPIKAIYTRPAFVQHCDIPILLGCETNEQKLLKVDMLQKTSVDGVYAAGDNSSPARSIAVAVAAGAMAGGAINRALIEESF